MNVVVRSTNDVSAVKDIYQKVFAILEESSYLSKRPHCMSRYSVPDTLMLSHVLEMMEPLQVSYW